MLLTVLSSESSGNCYLLQTQTEVLIIECGIRINIVKAVLNFDLTNIIGCISTHCHSDHFGRAKDFAKAGINIYTSKETIEASGISGHRVHSIEAGKIFKLGRFQILPFDVPHGVKCHGFLINHPDSGKILFATDCAYIPGKFVGLSHILVEMNYEDSILTSDRAVGAHLSLDNGITFLKATNLTQVRNIVLLHLSIGNSDARMFKRAVQEVASRAEVHIADKGLQVELKREPF